MLRVRHNALQSLMLALAASRRVLAAIERRGFCSTTCCEQPSVGVSVELEEIGVVGSKLVSEADGEVLLVAEQHIHLVDQPLVDVGGTVSGRRGSSRARAGS